MMKWVHWSLQIIIVIIIIIIIIIKKWKPSLFVPFLHLKFSSIPSFAWYFAIVLNHHATAPNHFAGLPLSVDLTEAYPFP